MQNPFLPLISFFVAALLSLGILSGIEAFREKAAPKQVDVSAPAQTTSQTVLVYTNDCPVCAQDGENCFYQCPFCKKGDHSTYTHRDPSEYFICPVCHCYHKASKELITQFKVLLKAKEQQAALFPQTPAPSENNP